MKNKLVRRRRVVPENPERFFLTVGTAHDAIASVCPNYGRRANHDQNGFFVWDFQEDAEVIHVSGTYANAICLETIRPGDHPFTRMVEWLNGLDNRCLRSEGMTPTKLSLLLRKVEQLERALNS